MLTETPTSSFNSTATPFDTSYSYAVSFDSASSMALTVVLFLLLFFFVCSFSIFARRFFATDNIDVSPRMPPLPPLLSAPGNYHRRYLEPIFGPAGLDPVSVRALPVLTYTAGSAKEVVGCVVCLGEFEEMERVKLIPGCGHVFHPGCIDGWLLLHGSCPICRCSEVFGAGANVGARNSGEIRVNLSEGPHDESGDESEGGEEKKPVGLGRSKSFCGNRGGGESKVFLRGTCSV